MERTYHRRTAILFAIIFSISACVSTPKSPEPSEAARNFVDDGTDYYSEELGTNPADEVVGTQWLTDENGERIYTLNSHALLGDNQYYVGDIRYLPADTDPRREVYYYDQWGNPVDASGRRYTGGAYPSPYGYGGYNSSPRVIIPSASGSNQPVSSPSPTPTPQPVTMPSPPPRPVPATNRNMRRTDPDVRRRPPPQNRQDNRD